MSAPHVHLILNHFPVVGVVAAAGLLTLAVVLRRDVLSRSGLWALTVSGVLAVPVYLTGTAAEDAVEELGVAESFIEAHEEAGLITLVALLVLGAVAASGLWLYRHRDRIPRKLVTAVWVLSLGGAVLVARTANLGGEIRHPEIRGELFGGAAPEETDERAGAEEADDEAEDGDRADEDAGDGAEEADDEEGGR